MSIMALSKSVHCAATTRVRTATTLCGAHQASTLASAHENTLIKQFKRSPPRAWAPQQF